MKEITEYEIRLFVGDIASSVVAQIENWVPTLNLSEDHGHKVNMEATVSVAAMLLVATEYAYHNGVEIFNDLTFREILMNRLRIVLDTYREELGLTPEKETE